MNFHGGYHGKDKLKDFSVNIPTIEYDPKFKALVMSNFDMLLKYPELSGVETINKMADSLQYKPEQMILGNGATELIYLYARTINIKQALILEPTFTEYRRALETHQVDILKYPLNLENPEQLEVDKITDFINAQDCDLLVICNPNNPTGHLYKIEDLEYILKNVTVKQFKIFIDESFIDFVSTEYTEEYMVKMRKLIEMYPMFLLRSMTKTYAVPGLRIGYGIGNCQIVDQLYKYKEPWSLNTFALLSIPFFLDDLDAVKRVRTWSLTENEFMAKELSEISGIKLIAGKANYHLIQIEKMKGTIFFDKLIEKGFYLRTCMDFIGLGEQYFRIALRSREENELLINAIRSVLEEA